MRMLCAMTLVAATVLAGVRAGIPPVWAGPETPSDAAAPPPPPFRLEPAKPVDIECFSKAVVVATGAANATTGNLRLSLLLKEGAANPQNEPQTGAKLQTGAWRIVSVDGAHTGSFAHREGKGCAESCPLTVAADGQIQIWSPAPKGVDQLGDTELLFVGVIKPANLDLRATTFNGKQIESLEEASCRIGS